MQTRLKGYSDYGLTDARVKEILKYCRGTSDNILINRAAEKANPYLAKYLAESLENKMSFEKLDAKYYMPCAKGDFYGYRRLVVALLNEVAPIN